MTTNDDDERVLRAELTAGMDIIRRLFADYKELRAENEELRAALTEVHRRTGLLLHQNNGRWNIRLEHDMRTVAVLTTNQELIADALKDRT